MNNDEECQIQPLMELSQDCIVEWNESQDAGRSVSSETTTPMSERGRGISPTSSKSNERRERRSIGLEEVRRKLEEQSGRKHRGRGDRKTMRSRNVSGEEEIDAIFDLLKQDDEGLMGTSPTKAATQRIGNRRTEPLDSYRSRPVVRSLASRRRRRQREGVPVSNKKKHIERPGNEEAGGATGQQCKTPPPNVTVGAFDSLLKQLTTRQSAERDVPIPSLDKENPSPLAISAKCPPNPATTTTTINQRTRPEPALKGLTTESLVSSKPTLSDSR